MKRIRLIILLFISIGTLFACTSAQSQESLGDLKEVEASKILKKIAKGEDVVLINSIILGDLNLTNLDDLSQLSSPTQLTTTISSTLYFQGCVFMGKVIAHDKTLRGNDNQRQFVYEKVHFSNNVVFFDCDFRDTVNFNESTFDRGIDFNQAVFRNKVSFNHISTFGQQNQFINMVAEKSFQMIATSLNGDINFKGAKFMGEANFQELRVNDLQMSNAEFSEGFQLSNATLLGNLYFNYVKCNKNCSFSFSRYMGRFDMLQCSFGGNVSIERSYFYGKPRFNRTEFTSEVNFVDSRFFVEPEFKEVVMNQSVSIVVQESKEININN